MRTLLVINPHDAISKPNYMLLYIFGSQLLKRQWAHRNIFIAPPRYNEWKPGGSADSSSDEEEKKNRRKKRADRNSSSSDEEEDEDGAGQGYAPKYMTYNLK